MVNISAYLVLMTLTESDKNVASENKKNSSVLINKDVKRTHTYVGWPNLNAVSKEIYVYRVTLCNKSEIKVENY